MTVAGIVAFVCVCSQGNFESENKAATGKVRRISINAPLDGNALQRLCKSRNLSSWMRIMPSGS